MMECILRFVSKSGHECCDIWLLILYILRLTAMLVGVHLFKATSSVY